MSRSIFINHNKKKVRRAFFIEELLRSWWVLAFILLCSLAFKPILKHLDDQQQVLLSSLNDLHTQKNFLVEQKNTLKLQIQSQKDPLWIEMLLKNELGLVSEGQKKVRFQNPS